MAVAIVNNRIDGTRITVWDIVHYLEKGRTPERIAEILSLPVEQVLAAVKYIDANKPEVMLVHKEIEDRIAKGNPPEVESILAENRARMQTWLKERRRAQPAEVNGAGHFGRH